MVSTIGETVCDKKLSFSLILEFQWKDYLFNVYSCLIIPPVQSKYLHRSVSRKTRAENGKQKVRVDRSHDRLTCSVRVRCKFFWPVLCFVPSAWFHGIGREYYDAKLHHEPSLIIIAGLWARVLCSAWSTVVCFLSPSQFFRHSTLWPRWLHRWESRFWRRLSGQTASPRTQQMTKLQLKLEKNRNKSSPRK